MLIDEQYWLTESPLPSGKHSHDHCHRQGFDRLGYHLGPSFLRQNINLLRHTIDKARHLIIALGDSVRECISAVTIFNCFLLIIRGFIYEGIKG